MHESQIRSVVYCARENGLQIRVRSGGHDDEGLSYTSEVPFVILDLINLQQIRVEVENKTAWVQAGSTIGELYYRIAENGQTLGFPAGVCPTVGVSGHFRGGGNSMGEDLFWAIRGDGGASFGAILAWKIQLVDVPEKVTLFSINRTLDQNATNIMAICRTKIRQIFARYDPYTKESRDVLLNRTQPNVRYFKAKSDYVQIPISKNGLEGIWKLFFEDEAEEAEMFLSPYGGRMHEISESTIPFPHRAGNLFPRAAYLNYRDLDIGVNDKGNTSHAKASIWGIKYFKNNFNRLVQVKTKVDPSNFFWNEQSIPLL
ncbi:FAD linked oxidase [Olea europaea subsp. europaea]|uniref:FAD linked oxidase n=1 Tax=Olea europaea subsp. europaea TaxID=158383 RepID=A0A8S0UVE6_OLEEU|nr:FAD linked oxidase [Olea europaea subsp. europaea]